METTSLTTLLLTSMRDLFILYNKKGGFMVEEYTDAGAVYKRLLTAIADSKESGSADVTEEDVTYVLSAINVCSQRVSTEAQNMKPISALIEKLTEAIAKPPPLE